jgi:hypothetical protein
MTLNGGAVEALLDERAILDTLYRYCDAIDHGRRDDLLDCFTDDGVWESRRVDHVARSDRGRVDLAAAFDALMERRPPGAHRQLTLNTRIALDGDAATAISYFVSVALAPAPPEGHPTLYSSGEYHDRLRRCDDGRWRLSARVIHPGPPPLSPAELVPPRPA